MSRTDPFNGDGFRPYCTCPKPVQLETQVMVTLTEATCTEGPVKIEQTVGVELKVGVSVGGTAVLVKVDVAVEVPV